MVTNKFFIQSREKLFCFEHSNAFSGLLNEIFVCARESDLLSHTPNVGLGETERYPEDYQGLIRARKTSKIC